MRKLILLAALLAPLSLAADLKAISETQGALVGAVEGGLGNPRTITGYIPGYGLHIAADGYLGSLEVEEAITRVKAVLPALVGTVKGLASSGDWVSVGYKTDEYQLIVRVRPADPTVVEVWVNGVQR